MWEMYMQMIVDVLSGLSLLLDKLIEFFPVLKGRLTALLGFLLLGQNTDQRQFWGRKGLFGLNIFITVRHEGKRGRNLEEETNVEAMGELAALGSLIHHRTTCPWVAPSTVGGAFPHQSLIKTWQIPWSWSSRQF